MAEKIDSVEKKKSLKSRKVNTKGCCFLCLRIVTIKTENEEESISYKVPQHQAVSLKSIRRYLKINTKRLTTKPLLPDSFPEGRNFSSKTEPEVNVDLCEQCTKITNKFSTAFASLEAIQLEVNYWLERIHQQISEASKEPELVQNYSKRMTSDPESLTQLVFVDKLRKEIREKSLQRNFIFELKPPRVILFPLKDIRKYLPTRKQLTTSPQPSCHSEDDQLMADQDLSDQCDDAMPFVEDDEDKDVKIATSSTKPTSSGQPEQTKMEVKPYYRNLKTGTIDCSTCNRKFKCRSSALYHNKAVHLGQRYKCELCGASYSHKDNLLLHKTKCSANGLLNNKVKAIKAERGTKSVFNPATGKYDCFVCKKGFETSNKANYHYNSVHVKTKYECKICNIATFRYYYSFLRHKVKCRGGVIRIEKFSKTDINLDYKNRHQKKCSENIKNVTETKTLNNYS